MPPPHKGKDSGPFQSIPPGADPRLISGFGTGAGPSTRIDATDVVLREEEAARASSFGRVVAILCAAGLAFAALDKTPPSHRIALVSAQVVLGCVGSWVWWRSRNPERYSRAIFRMFSIVAAIAAIIFVHYFGVFSPVTCAVVLGIAFFAQSDDVKWVFGALAFLIAAFAASGTLIALGITRDLGMFRSENVPIVQRLTMLAMVTAVMTMQLVQARLSRRATLDALRRATEAARVALTREAQLAEAKENLEVAMKAGGKSGRFSGALVGRFRLEDVVGRGGMGEIYAARQEGTPEGTPRIAVKLLLNAKRHDPDVVRRFLKEAEIAVRVRGPNLVEVYEAGETPDQSFFIAMELLSGRDLATHLRERRLLPIHEALTLIVDVAKGLTVLHAAGVVHRDLKPQNLFLTDGAESCWKILDYGVSKVVDGSATLTMGQLIGTPGYMSPEQAESSEVDQRSDVFSLGAVAYRALTGRRAFVGADTPQVLYQVVYGMPVRPREIVHELPRDVELVLALALAKKPAARFPSATAFASALRAATFSKLDPELRNRGERLLRQRPWAHDVIDEPGERRTRRREG